MEGTSKGGGAHVAAQGRQAPHGLVGYPVLQQVRLPLSQLANAEYDTVSVGITPDVGIA